MIIYINNENEMGFGMKKRMLGIACMTMLLVLPGCAMQDQEQLNQVQAGTTAKEMVESATEEVFAMDTYMSVTAYGEQAQEAVTMAAEEIRFLEQLLSTTDASSEVYGLNQSGGGTLSEDTAYLMERAMELYEDTEGTFNIAIYPLMEAWGFTTDQMGVPDEAELQSLLPLIDGTKIQFDAKQLELQFEIEGMAIDFGGIAKGYTSSKIVDIYRAYGIESGLLNLGGNVHVIGAKPDGSKWRVGVQSPYETDDYIGVLAVEDCAVITSGGYERYFEEDGETYHHIIDPSTGYPAKSGLQSVTIVTEDGTLGDALSTALFVMGKDGAESYWRAHSEAFDAILVTDDGAIYVTEGIADAFTAEQEVHVIEKEM